MVNLTAVGEIGKRRISKQKSCRLAFLTVTFGLLLGCGTVLDSPAGNLDAARTAGKDTDKPHIIPISAARHYTLNLQTAYLEREASLRDARTRLGLATLATGAVTLFYAITGRAHQDFITGSAIGTAALYAGSDIITDRLKQEIFASGAEALGCVFQGYAQVGVLDNEIKDFLTGDKSFNTLIPELKEADGAVKALGEAGEDTFRRRYPGVLEAAETTLAAANERRRQALDHQRFSTIAGDLMLMQARSVEAKVGSLLRDVAQDPLKVARSSTEVAANSARFAPTPTSESAPANVLGGAESVAPDDQDHLATLEENIRTATNELAKTVSKWDETIGHNTTQQRFQPPICDPTKPSPSKEIAIHPPTITIPKSASKDAIFRALVTGTESATGTFWKGEVPTELKPILEDNGTLSIEVTTAVTNLAGKTFTLGIRELSGHARIKELTISISAE